ncbi:amidohydrolase family protein [Bordetella trematum]|uniref:amidohydrolase family protein n=1 Tax=Bordetella trematum TaxID=123899 RepID=UPI00398A4DF0
MTSIPLSVDTHAHVFLRDLPMTDGRRYTPAADATLPDYLGLLDRHGLSHGVLIQPSFLGTDNRHLLAALATAKGRLRGVAVVQPGVGREELAAMDRAGVRGIRLNLFGQATPALARAGWRDLLENITALGWHVEIHTPALRLPEAMEPLLAAGCRIVVDHFGRPDGAGEDPAIDYLLAQGDSGRVWVKLSAAYRIWPAAVCATRARLAAQRLLRAFGATQLLWGSDWPHTEHHRHAAAQHAWEGLPAWIDDEAARRCILADTASALFGIKGDTP